MWLSQNSSACGFLLDILLFSKEEFRSQQCIQWGFQQREIMDAFPALAFSVYSSAPLASFVNNTGLHPAARSLPLEQSLSASLD